MKRVLVAVAVALVAKEAHAVPREENVPGHLLVEFRSDLPKQFRGARFERALADHIHLLHAEDDSPAGTEALRAALAADPDVAWVEPEHIRTRSSVDANDPLFTAQWALPLARIPMAWTRTRGSERVVVAVLDTGILPHPDLRDRYVSGYDFISDPANAGDGNGRDPDPTDAGSADPTSSGLHGTHVTGIIGAHSDNHLGIAGVDWNCRLLPVRVLGTDAGKGTDSDIADAIRWAAGLPVVGVPNNLHPAQIINMSFGGPGGSKILQLAIDAAVAHGVIVVAAAGNDAADTAAYAPAGLLHVIAVGAVLSNGKPASYSNHGARVDLMAPGGDLAAGEGGGILSTFEMPQDGFTYSFLAGTSQAAPHVAGVAALMKAIDPTITDERARAILRATADPNGKCNEGCGGGLLDANAALAAVEASCIDGHCDNSGEAISVHGGCSVGGNGPGSGSHVPSGSGATLALGLGLLALVIARRRG